MKIQNAIEMKNEIQAELKKKKFDWLVERQLEAIKKGMTEGRDHALWLFDPYYTYGASEMDAKWYTEYDAEATMMFVGAGYHISGRYIYWD